MARQSYPTRARAGVLFLRDPGLRVFRAVRWFRGGAGEHREHRVARIATGRVSPPNIDWRVPQSDARARWLHTSAVIATRNDATGGEPTKNRPANPEPPNATPLRVLRVLPPPTRPPTATHPETASLTRLSVLGVLPPPTTPLNLRKARKVRWRQKAGRAGTTRTPCRPPRCRVPHVPRASVGPVPDRT